MAGSETMKTSSPHSSPSVLQYLVNTTGGKILTLETVDHFYLLILRNRNNKAFSQNIVLWIVVKVFTGSCWRERLKILKNEDRFIWYRSILQLLNIATQFCQGLFAKVCKSYLSVNTLIPIDIQCKDLILKVLLSLLVMKLMCLILN